MTPARAESVISCANDQTVWPWQAEPYRLWSLLDMLLFSAEAFFWCGRALRDVRADCLVGSVTVRNGQPVFAVAHDLDQRSRDKALASLETVETEFRKIGLRITADMASDLIEELKRSSRRSVEWLHTQIDTVERVAARELSGQLFLYIPPERAKFWPRQKQPNVFGDAVATKFPSASYDIISSGECLAASMSTAAVFHLMRVMEIGLTALGGVFGVSLAHTNWGPAISEIERKIRNMHTDPAWKELADCKEQQRFYADAATHFAIIKDAWRNHTMHARGKYVQVESERIFESVRAFMQKLAERLSDEPTTSCV